MFRKLLLLLSLVAAVNVSWAAKKITIHVVPETAKIFIDGAEVGNGSYTVKFERNADFYMVKLEAPGYITRHVKLMKSNPKNTVLYNLDEDEAELNSSNGESGGIEANKWFDVTCRKGMSENVIWKRLIGVSINYFDNLEVRDKTAGWIKTEWKTTIFTHQVVRTRMEIRVSFINEEVESYRVRISSEIKDKDCHGNQCFHKFDRVLNSFSPLVQELQTTVGGGE